MRVRALLTAFAAVLIVPVLAPAAHAGTGSANWCSDGLTAPGGRDIPIPSGPITVGLEIYYSPTSTSVQQIDICFSDTAPGQPSRLVGGQVNLTVNTNTGTVTPGATAHLQCVPDLGPTGVWPTCNFPVGVTAVPGDLRVTTPASTICLVSLGSGCQAYLPGVKVYTDNDPGRPLLALNVLGTPVPVNAPPPTCIALIVSCP